MNEWVLRIFGLRALLKGPVVAAWWSWDIQSSAHYSNILTQAIWNLYDSISRSNKAFQAYSLILIYCYMFLWFCIILSSPGMLLRKKDANQRVINTFLYLASTSLNICLLQYPYRDMDVSKDVVLHLIHITINTLNAQYHSCRPHASAGPLYSDNSNISRYSEKEKGKILMNAMSITKHKQQ